MKILILFGPFASFSKNSFGGVEKFWYSMASKFKDSGHEVHIISKKIDKNYKNKKIDGIFYKRINGYNNPKITLFRLILDFFYTIKVGFALPKDANIIVTNTFWSPVVLPLFINNKSKIYVDVARMPKGQMFLYKMASRLRVNTKAVKKNILKEISKSQISKIKIIPPSLPFKTSTKINIKNKKKLIVFLGRIHREKGIELFINALNNLNLKEWKVKIIGPWKTTDGGSGEKYKKNLIKMINNKSVSIENPIPAKNITSLYKDTSIFVYPSLAKDETFGLSVIEFMSFGAAPIVSDLECFKDFINHNINGLIFNHKNKNSNLLLASSIKNLIVNQKLRFKIAKNALDIRNTHSIDKIGEEFLNDFKELNNEKKN